MLIYSGIHIGMCGQPFLASLMRAVILKYHKYLLYHLILSVHTRHFNEKVIHEFEVSGLFVVPFVFELTISAMTFSAAKRFMVPFLLYLDLNPLTIFRCPFPHSLLVSLWSLTAERLCVLISSLIPSLYGSSFEPLFLLCLFWFWFQILSNTVPWYFQFLGYWLYAHPLLLMLRIILHTFSLYNVNHCPDTDWCQN